MNDNDAEAQQPPQDKPTPDVDQTSRERVGNIPESPQSVGVIFHDIIDEEGIPCVSFQIQLDEAAKELVEPTPAMWFAIYLGRKFQDRSLMAEVEEFVRSGQFIQDKGAMSDKSN